MVAKVISTNVILLPQKSLWTSLKLSQKVKIAMRL